MNTRIIPKEYNYTAPQTLAEALDILKQKNVRVLAGGTDLIVRLKMGSEEAMETMLDIKRIPELKGIAYCEKGAHIGATTALADIEENAEIIKNYPALRDALVAMAAIAVRHMGTIGGNFVNASPVADTAGPVMVYGGQVHLKGSEGERVIPADEFFVGPGKSQLKEGELLTAITLPVQPADSGAAFFKKTRVKPDISKISTTVYVERDGETITNCRIAMGAVAAKPITLPEIAKEAIGKKASKALFAEMAAKVADTIKPIDDIRSTAEYRKAVANVMVAEAFEVAWKRAGGAL